MPKQIRTPKRQLIRRVIAGLLISAFCVVTGGIFWQRFRVIEIKQRLVLRGLPTNLEELDRYYSVPINTLDNSIEWNTAINVANDSATSFMKNHVDLQLDASFSTPPLGEVWEYEADVLDFLKHHSSVLNSLHQAAAHGGWARVPVNYSCGYTECRRNVPSSSDATNILLWDAVVAIRNGDKLRSRKSQRTALALCIAIQGQPDILGMMSSFSSLRRTLSVLVQLLDDSDWTDKELEALQSQICSIDFHHQLKLMIAGDCLLNLDFISKFHPYIINLTSEAELFSYYDATHLALSYDWPTALNQLSELDKQVEEIRRSRLSYLACMSFLIVHPGWRRYGDAGATIAAQQVSGNALLAVQRFRLRHARFPASLNEISPDLFGRSLDGIALLNDPFDGMPLREKVEPQSFSVYSIGTNVIDDGGNLSPDCRSTTNCDIGFSLNLSE